MPAVGVRFWFTGPMSGDATWEDLPTTLERLSDRAVPGTERSDLGQWRLRAGLGVTGRANSAWTPGPPSESVPDAVDQVEAWYRARRLTPRFQIFDDAEPELVLELDRRGWRATVDTLVMIGDALIVGGGRTNPPTVPAARVETTTEPTTLFGRLIGDDRRLAELTATQLPQRIAALSDGDELLGGGMATIDGRWAAVGAMNTHPEARRKGVASAVLAALATTAAEVGVDTVWLQVQSDNAGAVALYRRSGFDAVHRYRYRIAPDR